jgi:predicted Zn-dependent protease
MTKKKILGIAILLVIIFFSYTFTAVRFFAAESDNNPINRRIRPMLVKSELLRDLYGLHFDGDGKHDYLSEKTKKIILEIDQISSAGVDHRLAGKLAEQIEATTGKETTFILSDSDLMAHASYDQKTLRSLEKKSRDFQSNATEAVLYVLILDREGPESTIIGSTHREDGIIIYTQALSRFVAGKEESYDTYFLSTGLHEFGHQLGLAHNQQPGCLMSVNAEADQMPKESWQTVTDFCEYEKQLIKTAIK